MKNQSGSSRMDTVLKMLLIAFISLLAFSSGVFFGKQLSDSDYQLKALESDFKNNGTAVAENDEEQIGDEEVASLSEQLVNSEKQEMKEGTREVASEHGGHEAAHGDDHAAPAHGAKNDDHAAAAHDEHAASKKEASSHEAKAPAKAAASHGKEKADAHAAPAAKAEAADHGDDGHGQAAGHAAAPAKSASTKPDLSLAAKAAQRVANNAAPVEPQAKKASAPAEPRGPSSLPKTVGSAADVEFTVQVASYPTADAAKAHADDLVKKGFPAFPVQASVNGKVWYRVSVGSFKTQKDATTYRSQLLKQANLDSAIVQKIRR